MKTLFTLLFATVATLLFAADYELILLGDLHFDGPQYRVGATGIRPAQQEGLDRNAAIWKKNVPEELKAAGSKVSGQTRYVIQLGDFVQGDAISEDMHVAMLRDALAAVSPYFGSVPLLFAVGNHDVRSINSDGPGQSAAYRSFMLPYLKNVLKRDQAPEDMNYAVRSGDDLLLFIDAIHPDLSRIETQIAQNPGFKRLLVFTHVPILPCPGGKVVFNYTAGGVGLASKANTQPENRRKLLELLEKHNAYIFCGHTHKPAIVERKTEKGRILQMTCSGMASGEGAPPFTLLSSGKAALAKVFSKSTEGHAEFRKDYVDPVRFFELFPGWGFVVLHLTDDAITADLYSGNGATPEKTVILSEPMPEKIFAGDEKQ